MAIDKINWRRELKTIRDEVSDLKDEISQLRADINSISELLRLVTANQVLGNVEREIATPSPEKNISPQENSTVILYDDGEKSFVEATTFIKNKAGVHARPASVFVQTAAKFKSKIQLSAKGKTADAKSTFMLMAMGRLTCGTEIKITADGPDASDAVKSLVKLIDDKFGEE